MPQSGAKERPTTENSDVLNRNFDLSVIDHITVATVVVVHLCSFCSSCYVTVISTCNYAAIHSPAIHVHVQYTPCT